MKKILSSVFIIFALVLVNNAEAQKVIKSDDDSSKTTKKIRIIEEYEYGPKLGFNYAKVNADLSSNQKARFGLLIGFFGIYNMDKDFALQGELLYSQKGFKENQITVTQHYSFDYIDIPILFKYKFKLGRGLYSSVYAGPNFNFLVSAKQIIESEIIAPETELENINGFDLGISLGFDLTTNIADIGRFIFDFRYYGFDFINISEKDNSNIYSEGTHRVLSLSAGYYL